MPRKRRPRGQLPRGLGVPPISPNRTPHNHPDGRPISDSDIRAAWYMRIYTFPAHPGYATGHRLLACRGGGSLLEIVVANYGTERETIVHSDLLRDKFKRQARFPMVAKGKHSLIRSAQSAVNAALDALAGHLARNHTRL